MQYNNHIIIISYLLSANIKIRKKKKRLQRTVKKSTNNQIILRYSNEDGYKARVRVHYLAEVLRGGQEGRSTFLLQTFACGLEFRMHFVVGLQCLYRQFFAGLHRLFLHNTKYNHAIHSTKTIVTYKMVFMSILCHDLQHFK